jgi:hypothetical protein
MLDQEPQGPLKLGQLLMNSLGSVPFFTCFHSLATRGSARFIIPQRSGGHIEVEAEPCPFIQKQEHLMMEGQKAETGHSEHFARSRLLPKCSFWTFIQNHLNTMEESATLQI